MSNRNQIGDQQMMNNLLCSDIVNPYGQLIGEYSRLDDDLWFSIPDEDVHLYDDQQRTEEGLESNFTSSYEYTFDQAQLSKSINNPVSEGGTTSVKEAFSSLNYYSLEKSQTSSPVSVLQRRKRATLSLSIHSESYNESSRLNETPEHSPTKPVWMRKVSDLLLFTGGNNQANKTSILASRLCQSLEESSSGEEQNLKAKSKSKRKRQKVTVKKCMHCESTKTPQWREGPMGRATLCNACGVQYKKGKLFSEYRPSKSPTFDHSCVMEKNPKPKPIPKGNKPKVAVKTCMHCESKDTLQLREGSTGQTTRCNGTDNPLESPTLNPSLHSTLNESGSWERVKDPNPKPTTKREKSKEAGKKCMHCESTKTPQWREGPLGHKTLCNACGVQYRNGRLFPEYRPLKSPAFNPALHSHSPKKVLHMRMRSNVEILEVSKYGE